MANETAAPALPSIDSTPAATPPAFPGSTPATPGVQLNADARCRQINIGQHDSGAALSQRSGGGCTQPATRPSNQNDLVRE